MQTQTVKRTSTVIINRLQKAGYEHNSGVIIYEHNALYCENTEVQLSSIFVKWTKIKASDERSVLYPCSLVPLPSSRLFPRTHCRAFSRVHNF